MLAAESTGQTVGSIAARFGVWDFSQFARTYKALYGETPSRTLRGRFDRPRRERRMDMNFIRYISRIPDSLTL